MRNGASWGDVCILNISSRGLGLQAANPPGRGSYVEIRRGQEIIIACVVWTKQHRFGVRAQDMLPIEQIIDEPDRSLPAQPTARETFVERRSGCRPQNARHEHSRVVARAMEFACIAILGASAATAAFAAVDDTLGGPLSRISAALAAK